MPPTKIELFQQEILKGQAAPQDLLALLDVVAGAGDGADPRVRERPCHREQRVGLDDAVGVDRDHDLAAAAPFYGVAPPLELVPAIKATLVLHYAENDDGVNKTVPPYEEALKANNKKYTKYVYPGTQHAFSDDTATARYNKEAADLAWSRTYALFRETLGTPPKAS